MIDDDIRLCVTRQKCLEKGRVVYDHECITGTECSQKKCYRCNYKNETLSYYAYSATGNCSLDIPGDVLSFVQDKLEENVYDCGEKFFDARSFSCVEESACTGIDSEGYQMILYRSGHVCLGNIPEQRRAYNCYLFETGNAKECISVDECNVAGQNAYFALMVCVSAKPENDGNFVRRTDNALSCDCD